jgi:molecular chaperone DnaK (HSP70)
MAGAIHGVKLLLDDCHKPKYQPTAEARDFIKERETTPVRVASDYLRKLVAHAQDTLDRRFGSAVQSMGLEYVLTVPAVWSDKAKSASIVAAEEAGIPVRHLTLVSEPEAAALHCLHSIQPNTIEVRSIHATFIPILTHAYRKEMWW